MGLPKWFIIVSVWCVSGTCGYSVHRMEDEKPANLEIDFFSSIETNKFLDDLEKSSSQEDMLINLRNMETTKPPENDSTPLDSWSVVWYVASFGGLIVFFLIVSCSEWCCRRAIRNSQSCNRTAAAAATPTVPDTPPPSYDQFAPPSYESICLGRQERGGEKSEYDIYVVPVHALGTMMESREDAPPSYLSASEPHFVPAVTTLDNNRVPTVT